MTTTGAEDETAPNIYVLTASIDAAGTLQVTGPALNRDNVIETPRGQDALVKIKDIEGLYIFGVEITPRGERAGAWGRNTVNGIARRKFEAVSQDVHNFVYAVSTSNTAGVSYGPVITIKPKG
jgi:hypothetical protein